MPALQSRQEFITLEQYENLPEEKRVEIFDGIAYDMAGPSQVHQTILLKISSLLDFYISQKNGLCIVLPAPFDVKLSDSPLLVVQPDIMLVCDKNKLDGNRCNGAPDFIIEIVSPSNASVDYIRKLFYYEKYGVREYWIVDPGRRVVVVNDFENGLINVLYSFDSVIKVGIYDDLFIDFSKISKSLNT